MFYPGEQSRKTESYMGMRTDERESIDNEKRGTRLQQLVDNIATMQSDCQRTADEMDKANAQMTSAMGPLMRAAGVPDIGTLIERATAQMTAEEKAQFEAVSFGKVRD